MPKQKFDFEKALTELEGIVAAMEGGQMSLDDALTRFARGSELLKACQDTLTAAERRIEVLEAGLSRSLDDDALDGTDEN